MSGANGSGGRIRTTAWTLAVGILLGAVPGGVAGLMWHNWQLRAIADDLTTLEHRFVAATGRFDELKRDFEAEVIRERQEDTILARDIAQARTEIATLQGSIPLRLPEVREIIDQAKVIDAQNGRMDEIDRRLRALAAAQNEQHIAQCQALAKLSAASARGAGC